MKRKFIYLLAFVLIIVLLGFVGSRVFPGPTASVMQSALRLSAGLDYKTVETHTGTIHYLEGGQGETVVFIHGIYARKEHWIDMSRAVSDGYHVVLLDLPGFGDNDVLGDGAYGFDEQVENLLSALNALELEAFHIAANSMGAQIAAMIAIDEPERIKSIAFIGSPVGVTSPQRSEMEISLQNGNAPLVVTSEEDFTERLVWLFPKVPFIPWAIMKTWAEQEAAHATDNLRIWGEVNFETVQRLEDIAPAVSQPSLIVWCTPDRIFHVSGAEVLANALPDSETQILDDCGHVPMLDKPKEVGAVYRAFLDRL